MENYRGSPKDYGPDLMKEMRAQAERFGTLFQTGDVSAVDFKIRPFSLTIDGERTLTSKTVIIATGAYPITLGLPNERRLWGYGVSTCATCDGFFFRGKELVVVGGGDSALEEAIFLTKFATRVSIVHRRDKLRASKIMQDRALRNERIAFIWNSVVEDVLGEKTVTGVQLKNVVTGKQWVCLLTASSGHRPPTEQCLVFRQLDMDPSGFPLRNREPPRMYRESSPQETCRIRTIDRP